MDRFLARRATAQLATLLCLVIGFSACGSSSANSSAMVKQVWINFFSGNTSAANKIKLLQNGQQFTQIIDEATSLKVSKTSSATVTKVVIDSSTVASVSYTFNLGAKPVLQNQTGTAIKVGGKWLVADSTFCGLLALEGQSVPACSSYSASPTG